MVSIIAVKTKQRVLHDESILARLENELTTKAAMDSHSMVFRNVHLWDSEGFQGKDLQALRQKHREELLMVQVPRAVLRPALEIVQKVLLSSLNTTTTDSRTPSILPFLTVTDEEALQPPSPSTITVIITRFTCHKLRAILALYVPMKVPLEGMTALHEINLLHQHTELDPCRTSFFSALNVATKITKGRIEIMNDVLLCKEGETLGYMEAALLERLGIKIQVRDVKLLRSWVWCEDNVDGMAEDEEMACGGCDGQWVVMPEEVANLELDAIFEQHLSTLLAAEAALEHM